MSQASKPPHADTADQDPAIAEDAAARPDEGVAIELPIEDGDADAQPQ